jgi:hypothetical protein
MSGAWGSALAEHEREVGAFVAAVQRVPDGAWQLPMGADRWSPAALALHVAVAYELGITAMATGQSMRLRVSPLAATISRWTILPLMLLTKRFPKDAPAPREVRPDLDQAAGLTKEAVIQRIQASAKAAAAALQVGDTRRPRPTMTHAYFGSIPPRTTLRLLTLHTRHHRQGLEQL